MESNFQEDGTLSPGVHPMNLEGFKAYFVDKFPKSSTRRKIYRGFKRYVVKIYCLGVLHSVFVDGSYVTKKDSPGDIDISLVYNASKVEALSSTEKEILWNLTSDSFQEENKRKFDTHPYLCIGLYPPTNKELYLRSKKRISQCLAFWGHDRKKQPKGLVYIPFQEGAFEDMRRVLHEKQI